MATLTSGHERLEEILNAVTHGMGATFSMVGLVVLIIAAHLYGNIWHLVSFSIYGTSLLLLYLASTLYHSFRNERIKYIFKIFDHAAIYLLIAGTYTPFALVILQGTMGWTIFALIWSLALVGITQQILFVKRFKVFSTICYVVMGWLIVLFIKPLAAALPTAGLLWLVAGGVLYTVGAAFYLCRRLAFNHTIWHFFVLGGSLCHFITILWFVLPVNIPV
jgi:hemolysin III